MRLRSLRSRVEGVGARPPRGNGVRPVGVPETEVVVVLLAKAGVGDAPTAGMYLRSA